MGNQKDIADMSFEEFFSESKTKAERDENRKAAAQKPQQEKPKSGRGFIGAVPKINFNNGKFLLYVPRYEGLENDQFNVAVECGDRVVPLGRLESTKHKGGRTTRPATVDLTPADATPMDDFTFTIDGEKAFINKARPVNFYNSVGSPVIRPLGEVVAVTRAGAPIKLFKTELIESTERNGLAIHKVNVLVSGTVKIDESGQQAQEQVPEEPEKPVEEAPKEDPSKKPAAKKKPAKKVAVKGSVSLSQPSQDADAVFEGERLPLYAAIPAVSISVEGCDVGECMLRAECSGGEFFNGPASSQMYIDSGQYGGPVTLKLEKGQKVLATAKYFIIPGFRCEYSGKGDITEDTVVRYNVFGEEGSRDVMSEDPYSFEHGDMKFQIVWCVPAITFDIGNGPQPFSVTDVDILDLQGEFMTITVRGARKKALFMGGVTGKKKDITPGWEGDTYEVPLEPIRTEVFSAPSSTFCLYITVNSFPNRKFMTIRNPVRVKARYADGQIVADIDPSVSECVCRLYKIDKSVTEVELSTENCTVPVSDDVIEAEVVELHHGQPRTSITVPVRQLPFLHRDSMGDKWMYVSRSKRIPLPSELFKDDQPDIPAIRAWHDRIVRMNPELKGVTFEMIQKAFKEFK